ncbi:MAG TPA: hypothetical protein VNT32_12320 [Thermoleophilaceae bacterium]|nr:hypothetical protein [Thermoleophilaceae bacterium]
MRRVLSISAAAALLAMPAISWGHDPIGPDDPGHGADGTSAFAHMELLSSFPSGEPGARPTNSDIAFWGKYAYVGNYNGFRIFDISTAQGQLVSDVRCVGAQGDPSVVDTDADGAADLLVLSVDRTMSGPNCGAVPVAHDDPAGWEGLRLFDVSDPALPRQIGAVYQDCGSHTNTLLPQESGDRVLVLNSSYPLRPGPTCGPERGPAAGRDPLHGVVQVVEIPFDDPASAREITELPVTYPGDPDNKFTPSEQGLSAPGLVDGMRACHDIAVHTERGLVAGACAEQAQVWRIGANGLPDTENPVWTYDQDNVDFWHSATFSWDGKVTNFIDESFGEGCPTTTVKTAGKGEPREYESGNMFFLDTRSGGLLSEFRINRSTEGGDPPPYCSSHLGNVVPSKDRYLLVNAYYRGGSSVIDFTEPTAPREIAFSDLVNMDTWSAYWYESKGSKREWISTYGNDGVHTPNSGYGFEVFRAWVGPTERVGLPYLNPQVQERYVPMRPGRGKASRFRARARSPYARGSAVGSGERSSNRAFIRREWR